MRLSAALPERSYGVNRVSFPASFTWGAATSSQQIEGGRHAGGRSDSIWDRFAEQPGRIADGSSPDIACDHYHRWVDDVRLMRELGLGAYRFSIAWPRVVPDGRGPVNGAGLDFYERLVDALLENGIEPFPTLYHWDLPQTLEDSGGWNDRSTATAFADFAVAVARRLGDRVRRWVTHNEPWCAATLGYEEGHHAPGLRDPMRGLRAAHHLMLSHGWACAAMRREIADAEMGIVLIHCPAHAASDSVADREAARWFDGFFNRWYLDPIFRGEYPSDAIEDRVAAGQIDEARLPFVEVGDLESIATPLDFLGLNYYSRVLLRSSDSGGPPETVKPPTDLCTSMGWEIYPDGLRESLTRVHRDYAPPAIYLTENGAAFADEAEPDGRILDHRRIDYLRGHLLAAREAIGEGVPLRGYFVWSLMDNFEWAYGFQQKFGLYAVDPKTLDRTPKLSAEWYRQTIRENAIETGTVNERGDLRALDE